MILVSLETLSKKPPLQAWNAKWWEHVTHQTEEMIYRFDLAKSFISGYYEKNPISRKEFDLIFAGAIQTHISYMKVYGPEAVNSLWKILKFGIKQKESLWMYLENQ